MTRTPNEHTDNASGTTAMPHPTTRTPFIAIHRLDCEGVEICRAIGHHVQPRHSCHATTAYRRRPAGTGTPAVHPPQRIRVAAAATAVERSDAPEPPVNLIEVAAFNRTIPIGNWIGDRCTTTFSCRQRPHQLPGQSRSLANPRGEPLASERPIPWSPSFTIRATSGRIPRTEKCSSLRHC